MVGLQSLRTGYRALSSLPVPLLLGFKWVSLDQVDHLLRVVGVVDSIYNGSVLEADFGDGAAGSASTRDRNAAHGHAQVVSWKYNSGSGRERFPGSIIS